MAKKQNEPLGVPDIMDDSILADMDKDKVIEAPITPVKNQKAPEGFVNPARGTPEHFCFDQNGRYQPGYKQLFLERHNKDEQDPQYVRAGDRPYRVPREMWVDAPEEVITALRDAVEESHTSDFDRGKIEDNDTATLTPVVHTVRRVRRFSFQVIASA